ncbi:type II secretion system F family protein [Gallaecimonas kandeliae]|uniref:type II secretion system F family protein n=1 Tax=Gallaecimonas kandeliae TaxID=3029055 RepID=UPI002649B436|nr:type II secretion system F family protein [Gallaecimonas kandeliae]WKE65672.1 type II secretion system F family protein [Gallaecimonas kandeliae]
MARYRYRAVTRDGDLKQGELEGSDPQAVIRSLQSQELIPLEVLDANAKRGLNLNLSLGRGGVGHRQVLAFTQDLAALLQAGIALDRALAIMGRVGQDQALEQLVAAIREGIQKGQALSLVLAEQGCFSPFYINMIQAAETAGSLAQGLNDLAYYLERSQALRERTLSALIYPLILLTVAGISLLIILTYVVPQFEQLFSDMGQALPLPTRVVIGTATFLKSYGLVLAAVLLALAAWWRRRLAQPEKRLAWDGWLLRLPLLGMVVKKLEMARFSRSLGTLMKGGVPLLSALGIARETLVNQVLAQAIKTTTLGLKEGKRLAEPLLATGLFPPLAMQMIQVGEETGQLDDMLLKVANVYDREVETAITRLLAVMEPLLIVGLGVLIAAIIISILMAILSINQLPL